MAAKAQGRRTVREGTSGSAYACMSRIAWLYPRRACCIYGRSCEPSAPVLGVSALSQSRGKASSERSDPSGPCPFLRQQWPNRQRKSLCLCLWTPWISSRGILGISCNVYADNCCISFPHQKSPSSDGRCGVHACVSFSQSVRHRLGPVASTHQVPTSGHIWRRECELFPLEVRGWLRQFSRVDGS